MEHTAEPSCIYPEFMLDQSKTVNKEAESFDASRCMDVHGRAFMVALPVCHGNGMSMVW
jgi:hypothetical protein